MDFFVNEKFVSLFQTIWNMELRIDINYNQILRLIRQLPKKDIKKLTNTLQSEIAADKSTKSLQWLILHAPTWTDSDLNDYNEARIHINKSRIA
jgi:hypothetical protein